MPNMFPSLQLLCVATIVENENLLDILNQPKAWEFFLKMMRITTNITVKMNVCPLQNIKCLSWNASMGQNWLMSKTKFVFWWNQNRLQMKTSWFWKTFQFFAIFQKELWKFSGLKRLLKCLIGTFEVDK